MANPNIVNVTQIFGKTTYLTPAVNTPLVLVPNAALSGKVFKINQITAANVDGSAAADVTVSIYTNGAVAQGSAPSGGTAYPIASTISVPADTSVIIVDKNTSFYLEEGVSVIVTSGTASDITFTISYEEIN
jgi:hypothetical protein